MQIENCKFSIFNSAFFVRKHRHHVSHSERSLIAQHLGRAKILSDCPERDEYRTIATFAGPLSQIGIDVDNAGWISAPYRVNYLLVKQVSGRLVFIRSADDQSMAQVAARNQRHFFAGCGCGVCYRAPESQMLLVRLVREPYHDYLALPSGLVEVIQRNERAVIQRVFTTKLSQF